MRLAGVFDDGQVLSDRTADGWVTKLGNMFVTGRAATGLRSVQCLAGRSP